MTNTFSLKDYTSFFEWILNSTSIQFPALDALTAHRAYRAYHSGEYVFLFAFIPNRLEENEYIDTRREFENLNYYWFQIEDRQPKWLGESNTCFHIEANNPSFFTTFKITEYEQYRRSQHEQSAESLSHTCGDSRLDRDLPEGIPTGWEA